MTDYRRIVKRLQTHVVDNGVGGAGESWTFWVVR